MGPPTTSSSATPSLDATVTKDTYIPLFSGAPQDFKEWRKRINIYYKKMEITNRKAEAVLNLIGSLQGTAWKLVEDFNLDDAGKDNAWKDILKKLDAAFQYDSRVQLPNDFDSYFNLQRAPGQTLLQYVTTHDELYRRICDHSITLPGAVQGWHLLRRAGLSKDQRQLVLTQSPGLEKNKVQEALFLLFGQDFKAGGQHHDRRWKGKARGKGYAVYEEEEDPHYEEGWDEAYYEFEDADLAEYEYDPVEEFDQEAIYYQDEVGDASPLSQEDQQHQVEEYDEAFAAYVDARRRFNDIKLSRGFLPIVALSDPNAGNVNPGLGTSSPASSKGGGKGHKGKKGKGRGGGKNSYRTPARPAGKGEIKSRSQAGISANTCLRCGAYGHRAAECPVNRSPNKRPAPSTASAVESVAFDPPETGHVIFQDSNGHERTDAAMLDPGASAFLCGYGPFRRYVEHLRSLGFPLERLEFARCYRKFHFGGDAESWCRWMCSIPAFLDGGHGTIQCYLIPGDTPMLIGRPIMEALHISLDFAAKSIRFGNSCWQPATIGIHGEYLLPLTSGFDLDLLARPPHFEYVVPADDLNGDARLDLEQFDLEEKVFYHHADSQPSIPVAEDDGLRPLKRHQLRTCEVGLTTESNYLHSYVTSELHSNQDAQRTLWEVYCGGARTSSIAESLGMKVEQFDLSTGWNFDLLEHQEAFKERLRTEAPHEVLLAPTCGPWSRMQNLSAQTEEQRAELQALRQWHHQVHLKFCRDVYLIQVNEGRHAHLEQPMYALSWKTSALKRLPGHRACFDQCAYGCACLDQDNVWRLVKKPTCLLTTKRAVLQALSRRCSKDHNHCHLEGTAQGYGRRTTYLENYQPALASVLAASFFSPELPQYWEHALVVDEQRAASRNLIQLMTDTKQEAVRTVQRLHRNLGHPSTEALVEILESRGASTAVIEAAKGYKCVACLRYRRPNKPSPSTLKQPKEFGEAVQADVIWIKTGDHKTPLLSMIDVATKYQVATVVTGERTEHLIHALERCWVRHFGPPKCLWTDGGRGWCSDVFMEWTTQNDVTHEVAPGEAHTRLSVVERRHQILRKSVEVFMHDLSLHGVDGIKKALVYVLPQINAHPSVAGFSPSQWVLGKQPTLAGELLGEHVNPRHLQGDHSFEEVLHNRAMAKTALIQAETDRKLRRALLRRYAGTNFPLRVGQTCFYWRDARQPDLVKIRWLGPARVLLREEDENGVPTVYWIAHKTQLLRCAPHHVRADFRADGPSSIEEVEQAKIDVRGLKSRGVTRYHDLNLLNKANIDDVNSDEELMDDDEDDAVQEPPRERPRLTFGDDHSSLGLLDDDYSPSVAPALPDSTPDLQEAEPTLLQPPSDVIENIPVPESEDEHGGPPVEPLPAPQPPMELDSPVGGSTVDAILDETEPSQEPSAANTVVNTPSAQRLQQIPSAPIALDPVTASYYEPATEEDFASRRRRYNQQETLSFGPARARPYNRHVGPYSSNDGQDTTSTAGPSLNPVDAPIPPVNPEVDQLMNEALAVMDFDPSGLPEGWYVDEQGYFQTTSNPCDWWEVRSGCLIRHHVVPRHNLYVVKKDPKLPVDVSCLDNIRVTMMKDAPGSYATVTDDGSTTSQQWISTAWTGVTIFQINGKTRKEMAMVVRQPNRSAGQVAKTIRSQAKKKAAAGAANLSERHMTLDERQAFQQAKMKELQSFFQNSVWEFSTTAEADPARTLSSRMLLKWSRNPDGSPRAKARLIVRGYADLDALEGKVDTAAPTTSRLSRSFLLSVLANCKWSGWTADVSTAFLQGLPQSRKLWVKLPTECLHLLGADENTRMFLNKPCYGQIDAPRRWYLEAVRRLKSLGFRQHLLDPCCFLIYEDDFDEGKANPTVENTLGPQRLCGMVCIHVDDLLGAGNVDSVVYQRVVQELKKTFNFREWKESNEQETSKLEYCGATLEQYQPHCWKLHHQEYFKKVKPIPLGKDRSPEDEMTPKELSQLRGLLGSLQWPAVQSSPHIQCSTSLISGSMSAGLVKSIVDANKLLRFCKENADVGAKYEPLGDVNQLRLVCMFDAAFGVRRDASSQGGHLIVLVSQETFNGEEKPYHLIDWKSSKLPRIARSSLGAESQAAGQAVDAVDFCPRFWEHLLKPDLGLRYLLEEPSTLKPVMITDAKALYDSYHREGIGGNVTDKRTGLEIRVTKERLQGLDGSFKWISSERQYADGLTKEATRQLLADRIRHGKTKFTWDPLYTAAKKKKLSDRNKSRDEFTTPNTNFTSTLTSPSTTLNNNGEKKRKGRSEVRIYDEASGAEGGDLQTYFAGVDGLIEYVNVSESMDASENVMTPAEHEFPAEYEASKNVVVTAALAFLKLLFTTVEFIVKDVGRYCLIAYVMVNLVSGVQAAPKGQCEIAPVNDDDPDDRSLWMFVFAILAGTFVLGLLIGSRRGRLQEERRVILEPESEIEPEVSAGTETPTDEAVAFQEEIARLNGLVARHENTINMMRAAEILWQAEIGRFRRIRTEAMRIFDRPRAPGDCGPCDCLSTE